MKKSYLYASVTVVIWATLAPVVKLLLADIPSFEALAISSAFAFVFLLIVSIISGSIKLMKTYRFTDYLIMAALGFIGLFAYSALYYFGIDQLSSQEACILNYLWPIMIVLFACIILKEKLLYQKLWGVFSTRPINNYLLFYCFFQLLPYFNHSVGVKPAVFQQILPVFLELIGSHILHQRERLRRFTAVMYTLKVMIIQRGIIREQRGKDKLDGTRTLHSLTIIIFAPERYYQVDYMVVNVHQVLRKIGIQLSELFDSVFFKGHIIRCHADIFRNVNAQLFSELAAWIIARLGEILFVM